MAPTVVRVWNALRARTDPVLQLAAPATLPFGAHRLIDYLVAASSTVGEGVLRIARFFHLIAAALTLRVVEGPEEQALCLTTGAGGPVPPVYVEYVFAALVRRIRMRIGPQLRVRWGWPVHFRVNPLVDPLRGDPRFTALIERMGFAG